MIKSLILASTAFSITLGIIASSVTDRRTAGGSSQVWVQPDKVANSNATRISNHEWAFDYSSVESLIQALVTGSDGILVLNSHTAEALDSIASALPEVLTNADIERIGFLSQQGFSAPAASEVATKLTGFLRYRQAERQRNTNSDNESVPAQAWFKLSVALQDQYLGTEPAAQLFGPQRRLKQYLLKRRAIQANSQLSATQRQNMLERISNQFQAEREQENTQ